MKRKVLIADDNEINRRLLTEILSSEYGIIEASDGREALTVLGKECDNISAVLLDLAMPEMDGYEMLAKAKADKNTAQIPVIITTGSTDELSELRALSLGAVDYITKPYNPEIILHRLRNTIQLRETAAIANMSKKDDLTSLLNRKTFFETAAEMISQKPAGYYVMACFDIDNFKVINDQYGTRIGDDILRHVADVFLDGFAPVGGICCRIMADHFAVLYPCSFMDSAELPEIRRRAADTQKLLRPLTFSIGRYIVDDKALSVSSMFDRAAMAEASVKGRYDKQIALYTEQMRERILREQEITGEMNSALKNGNFEVWLQPQYNHSTGALIGSEALVRWRHPQKGIISPALFIGVFERNGFIYELDKYVWENVCRLLRKWLDEGRSPLPVSVNISRYDVFRSDLVNVITGLVEKYALPVDLLRLEITESAFAKSSEQIISVVKQLISCGFTVEIDDFGSGYSSLNTLKDVPANILKLDMRFLEGGDNSERGGNILESIIRMARWLGMPVIAEGVETKSQADYLESIGCSYIQGYYYARPMPAAEFELLAAQTGKEYKMKSMETVETLNNSAFWDPSSMDTLIYNSYVGGACIIECSHENVELLRINRKFAELFGGRETPIDIALKIRWHEHIDESDIAKVLSAIKTASDTNDEVCFEITVTNLSGMRKTLHVRMSMRIIARAGERILIYCTCDDITDRCEAENKLIRMTERLRFMSDTAGNLLSDVEPTSGIDSVLHKAIEYFGGSRAYIYEYFYDEKTCANTYEVCADGVLPYKDIYKKVPLRIARHWLRQLRNSDVIQVNDFAQDVDFPDEMDISTRYNAASLLSVALRSGSSLMGTLGIINPTKNLDDIESLKILGKYISVILARRDYNMKLTVKTNEMANLWNDMPGGFARIRLHENDAVSMTYANDGFCRLLDMSYNEIMKLYGLNAMNVIHPEDAENISASISDMNVNGGRLIVKCRLKHGKCGYIEVTLFGRLTQEEDGARYINVYFTDLSEREKNEASLQDILPLALSSVIESSADILFIKNKKLEYICCSKALLNLTNAVNSDIIGKTDRELLPCELADRYHEADLRVMESGQPLLNYIVSIPSKDGSIHYARTSKYPLCDAFGNTIGIYGIGFDVTDSDAEYARLKMLTDSIHGGLAIMEFADGALNVLYFNDGFYNLTGYSRGEYTFFAKENPLFLVFSEDLPEVKRQFDEILEDKSEIDVTYRIHTKSGAFRWHNLKGTLSSRQDNVAVINIILFDVTAQCQAADQLHLSEEQYRLAVSLSGNLICTYDISSKTLYLTPSFAAMFGVSERLRNVPYEPIRLGLISAESVDSFISFFEQILHGENAGISSFCCKMITGQRWFKASYSTIYSSFGAPISAVIAFADITEERRKEEEHRFIRENERVLKMQAEIDGMTGLYNKTTTEAMITQRLVHGSAGLCSMIFVDLDNLKTINDNLGHPQGDKTIRMVAETLEAQFRRNDIVGRIGGDEFIVFLSDIGNEGNLRNIVKSLFKKLSLIKTGDANDVPVTISIGVAVGESDRDTFDSLYDHADKALYFAKRNGKNQTAFYSAEM